MKRMTLLLLAASLLPSCVLAWNTPGEDFSGELKLGGPVTSTRNPWVWKVGEGNTQINTKAVSVLRSGEQVIPVPLPAMTVLLGKTILTTPAGREGLAPQVTYGKYGHNQECLTEGGITQGLLPPGLPGGVCRGGEPACTVHERPVARGDYR